MEGKDKAFILFMIAMVTAVVILGSVGMITKTYQTKPNPNMTATKIIDCTNNCTIRIKLIKE